ncbi:hypothetical protein CUC08_Gglean011875 [Alternaria sp. MG1]|nr:hypothetical protein CUC08_Gglean011875 [Alternaria sp. MG1]
MQHPARDNTTYSGNQAYGESTNFYGNVYGNIHCSETPREAGEPSPQQCLRDLRVTDPREDRARIEGDKDRLLRDCYAWILDDASFQRWRTQDASRLLWIKGDPGKGKTMMAMGVIAELSRPESLSYVAVPKKPSHVSRAVAAFVDHKVERLATVQKYDRRLQAEVQQQLRDKAEGTFLWVSLVCKELEKVPLYRTQEVLQELPPGLDPLYERMMAHIVTQDARTVGYCRGILRSITLAFRPLQLEELAATAGLPRDKFGDVQAVADLVSRCGSFLTVREAIISFVHLSAKDFFTIGNGRQVLNGTLAEEQGRMTNRLLDAMDSTLRRDMCSLQKPGVRIQEATGRVRSSCLPQVAYACEYWVEHVQAGRHACSDMLVDGGKVHSFFQKHLLHWLEAMSLLQKMSEAILALQKLEAAVNVSHRLARQIYFH